MAKGRIKQGEMRAFEKILTLMLTGKSVSKDEIMNSSFGKELFEYRMSSYILNMKYFAKATIKVHKDGRKVTGYQLMNVDEIKAYLTTRGFKLDKKFLKLADVSTEQPAEQKISETI